MDVEAVPSPTQLRQWTPSRLAFAHRASDTDAVRLQKNTIFLVASACCVAGVAWSLMYTLALGWGLTAFLPLLFVVVVGGALVVSERTKNHYYAVYAQIICILYITAAIQWSIGGVFDSGFVMAWALCGPITALIFFSLRTSLVWFGLYLVNLIVTVALDHVFAANGQDVADTTRVIFFIMNLGVSSAVVFVFAAYFMLTATEERDRADALLLGILPREIAPRLKSGEKTIADHFESASVLFVDMVGSTPLFVGMAPSAVVDWINEVFSMFDLLSERHGAEKIRTIGDNYMVAAGVPLRRADHAQVCVALALDMIEGLEQLPPRDGKRMAFRFGINSGPLIAGVIGERKFQYDLWGDTVNTAARMESTGEVGRVQISASTHALVHDEFECAYRGTIAVKGKGEMQTWFVLGRKRPGPRDGTGADRLNVAAAVGQ